MRIISIILIMLLLAAPALFAEDNNVRSYKMHSSKSHFMNGSSIDFDDGTLVLERHGRRGIKVEITRKYELFVDGDLIKTNKEQQRLVEETYQLTTDIIDRAKTIGLEGAKIGLEGAKLGLKAVGGVFKMAFTEYTSDDLEEDMERAAEKLEDKADQLEHKADKIEIMAEDLEETFYSLIEMTPELKPLR